MAPENPNRYLIFRHEKVGILDILRLPFTRRRLTDYEFVESSTTEEVAFEFGDTKVDWYFPFVVAMQKKLAAISRPLALAGLVIEFILNLLSLNGGFLGLLCHVFSGSVVTPVRGTANFRSIVAHVDDRIDLDKGASLLSSCFPRIDTQRELDDINLPDLTMMAAKVAYENEAYIKEAVDSHWKMHFVGFFDCWNKFLFKRATQAFIFCDKEEDASLICVAFRGTEPFDAQQWMTGFDFSSISMGTEMGCVHLGFMKALGLQDEKDFAEGFPAEAPEEGTDKSVAYYTIRRSLEALMAAHPDAKIVVTGLGLGAALGTLFTSLLAYHGKVGMLSRVRVMAHAQPRVGDATFASFMSSTMGDRYLRTAYRYDIVPRLPFDIPLLSDFKHFGTCVYYENWYELQEVSEVPNKNYMNPRYLFRMYAEAWGDLTKAMSLGKTRGEDFAEGWVSLLCRFLVLLLVPILGPGLASHGPRDYVNARRLAKKVSMDTM